MGRKHFRHGHASKKAPEGFKSTFVQYCLIAVVILCGVIWGAKIAGSAGTGQENSFGLLLEQMLSKNSASKGFISLFLSSFFSSSLLLCAAFALGLCAIGSPGHIAVALFKGIGIGLSMGYIYMEYGMKGFAICALFILPWAIITSLAVMLACRDGIRFSFFMARAVLPSGTTVHIWKEFCDYCLRYITCFVLALIAAVIEALSTIAFSILFFS